MEKFDLEKALAGEPVVTRDGREVTEIYFFKTYKGDYPIIALIECEKYSFTKDGFYSGSHEKDARDLLMKSKVVEAWVNVYQEGNSISISQPYESEEIAIENIRPMTIYIKTIKITNEI